MRDQIRLSTGIATLFSLPLRAWANIATPNVITNIPGCDWFTGYLDAECIPLFVAHLITLVFGFLGVFFVINVMVAGYQLAIGSLKGDKGPGVERLRWSIYGFILTACAYLILDLVWNMI